jgi:hypothetical protein
MIVFLTFHFNYCPCAQHITKITCLLMPSSCQSSRIFVSVLFYLSLCRFQYKNKNFKKQGIWKNDSFSCFSNFVLSLLKLKYPICTCRKNICSNNVLKFKLFIFFCLHNLLLFLERSQEIIKNNFSLKSRFQFGNEYSKITITIL